jgi:hypothetical protein
MSTPHKHAEIIKAWADGYQIEAYNPERDSWITVIEPGWFNDIEYRVKPGVIELTIRPVCVTYDVFVEQDLFDEDLIELHNAWNNYNLRLVFKDGKLVKAYVIDESLEKFPW